MVGQFDTGYGRQAIPYNTLCESSDDRVIETADVRFARMIGSRKAVALASVFALGACGTGVSAESTNAPDIVGPTESA